MNSRRTGRLPGCRRGTRSVPAAGGTGTATLGFALPPSGTLPVRCRVPCPAGPGLARCGASAIPGDAGARVIGPVGVEPLGPASGSAPLIPHCQRPRPNLPALARSLRWPDDHPGRHWLSPGQRRPAPRQDLSSGKLECADDRGGRLFHAVGGVADQDHAPSGLGRFRGASGLHPGRAIRSGCLRYNRAIS